MKKSIVYISLLSIAVVLFIFLIQSCNNNTRKQKNIASTSSFVFKEKLSEYAFFQPDLKTLKSQAVLIHYELATPLFTDYTVKDRFVLLPKGKAAVYKGSGLLDFPDSTIIIKNFAYANEQHQKINIETRLLVKDPQDHQWKVMDYLWNNEQTDAIKHITGARISITLLDDDGNKIATNYQVPTTNDCKRCHINNAVLTPIGVKARNLNYMQQGETENQLLHWASIGALDSLPALDKIVQLPNWTDAKHFTLEQRARAYIDVNCAHCHNATGDAANTGLYLEYEQTDPNHLGIMKEPVSAGGGAGGLNYDIIPGDAAHSIFAYRMNSTEPGTAMPELARTIVHKEGVRLIVDWINKMKEKK
ncbi:MAG: SO2930 family diheme c-type cytochrome [Panacibacter sp.]